MEYQITSEMLYAGACLVYIFSGVFCGATRWLHMCKPYGENGEYFYPGRKQATFFFSALILQFPYILNPMDADIWMYIRVFGIIYYPVCFSLIFKRFFSRKRLKRNNKRFIYSFVSSIVIVALLLISLFYKGDLIGDGDILFKSAVGLLSLFLTYGYIEEARRIATFVKKLNEEDYSNEDDFPYLFAKKIHYTPIFWIISMWAIFLTGNHWIKFVVDILLTIWMVGFLSVILHPQQFYSNVIMKEKQDKMILQIRNIVKVFIKEKVDITYEDEVKTKMATDFSEEVQKEVIDVLLKRFREPHLQKADVLKDISLGNKKSASLFMASVGYYNLVNYIRLKYATFYANANPRATKDAVAMEAGFSTRFGLNSVQNKNIVINLKLLDEIEFHLY